jgi:hypothetical protein
MFSPLINLLVLILSDYTCETSVTRFIKEMASFGYSFFDLLFAPYKDQSVPEDMAEMQRCGEWLELAQIALLLAQLAKLCPWPEPLAGDWAEL